MPPIVGICGRSNVGKTTLVERVLPVLVARGRRVAVLKHDVHGFTMDRAGSDTDRARTAGAIASAIVGPNGFGATAAPDGEGEPDGRALAARWFGACDLVLAEGFKRAAWPKIEVLRGAVSTEPTTGDAAAWVADFAFAPPGDEPVLAPSDVDGIAAQIGVLARRQPSGEVWRTSLVVDGHDVALKPFLHDLIGGLVSGLLEGLARVGDEPRDVTIVARRTNG